MTGLVRADSIALPLADESVDLIVTSPPYFALRSYEDGGEHFDGQIGAEPTPSAFLDALWTVTAECKRVLKPTGSMFVNLGDKYAGSGGHNNAGISSAGSTLEGTCQQDRTGRSERERELRAAGAGGGGGARRDAARDAARRQAPNRYNQSADVTRKSLMGLPWLYALGCTGALAALGGVDPGLDLVLRAEILWAKPNGLPESVRDRVRRSHEQWFHLTKSPEYFADLDQVRIPAATANPDDPSYRRAGKSRKRAKPLAAPPGMGAQSLGTGLAPRGSTNPAGTLPGSVWEVSTEPLIIPEDLGVDHFAAFPLEWPRRLILGWSPAGICVECGEPRRRVVIRPPGRDNNPTSSERRNGIRVNGGDYYRHAAERAAATIDAGDECGCVTPDAPTRPAVVLDPFGGTGTTTLVANALGRYGVSVDLSSDYLRLARWRTEESGHDLKIIERTYGKGPARRERRRRTAAEVGVEELELFPEALS